MECWIKNTWNSQLDFKDFKAANKTTSNTVGKTPWTIAIKKANAKINTLRKKVINMLNVKTYHKGKWSNT